MVVVVVVAYEHISRNQPNRPQPHSPERTATLARVGVLRAQAIISVPLKGRYHHQSRSTTNKSQKRPIIECWDIAVGVVVVVVVWWLEEPERLEWWCWWG